MFNMMDDILRQKEQLEKLIEYFRFVLIMNHVNPDDLANVGNSMPTEMDVVAVVQAMKLIPSFKRDIKMLNKLSFVIKNQNVDTDLYIPSLHPIGYFEEVSVIFSSDESYDEPGPVTGDEIIHVGLLDAFNCEDVKQLHDELYRVQEAPIICVFRKKHNGEYVICEVSTDDENKTDFICIRL